MRRLAILAAVGLTLVVGGCEVKEETPEKVNGDDGGGEDGDTFAVNDVVELGDFQVQVYGVQDPLPPTEFFPPAAGMHYVGVDFEITNTSDESQLYSVLLSIELQDDQNQTYTIALTDHEPQAPDGELAAGQAKRGLLVFEVPDGATGLTLNFTGDLLATGQVQIELT